MRELGLVASITKPVAKASRGERLSVRRDPIQHVFCMQGDLADEVKSQASNAAEQLAPGGISR